MGSFIKHITGADERIILLARLHWVYLLEGAIWMLILAGLGGGFDYVLWKYLGASAPFAGQDVFGFYISQATPVMTILFGIGGILIFVVHAIKMLATEIALTNQRIIYKTGLIFVEVEEIDLVEIRAEHVHHGLLGRFLGYGRLKLDSRFVGDIELPAVRKPYKLIKAMHTVRSKLHDPMDGASSRVERGHNAV